MSAIALDQNEARIKIRLPLNDKRLKGFIAECVWVKPITNNTGVVDNLPLFSTSYRYKDIIEFNPETWEAIRVIADGGYRKTELIDYEGRFVDEKGNWEEEGYVVEGYCEGWMTVTRKRKSKKPRDIKYSRRNL